MNGEFETLHGRVEHVTYKNQQTGYTVFKLALTGETVVVTGNFPYVSQGDVLNLTGEYVVHNTYGPQFKAYTCEKEAPTDEAAILRYLSCGAIKGIGPATAGKIIKRFGNSALDVIKNQPERLCEIKGISPDKADKISKEYMRQFGIQDLMFYLSKFKASPEDAAKIYKQYGERSVEVINQNPYVLCSDEIGFTFDRADEIAESLNIPPDNENRIHAGLLFVLRHNLMNGHTCLPRKKLCDVVANLLGCSPYDADDAVDTLLSTLTLRSKEINDTQFVFLPQYYAAEEYISARLCLCLEEGKAMPIDELEIDYIENRLHIKYDENQRKVIKTAFQNTITVLTGGPGTGKTTTLNGLIELFEQKEMRVLIAAPTGRAAQRISELTGYEAKTIHRLLEVQWGEGDKPYFDRNERNPLVCDVIIIDEMSMVDTLLFESLLRALRLGTRIILVGDSDQLPSVSAGNVLHDIIDSSKIPVIALNKIYRQSDKSLIVHNAHEIINGKMPVLNSRDADFFMLDSQNGMETAKTVVDLVANRLPRAYGFEPMTDIQVLCPSRKLDTGTQNLNLLIQEQLNPQINSAKEIRYGGFAFRENDKVMQTKNNYDISWVDDKGENGSGVYNGDIGVIESIDVYSELVTVRFDDRIASYYGAQVRELELAYAVTVHKSQGSEFNCIILPLCAIPSQLLYRNLLYTAVTRAKRLLVIVGDRETVAKMVENDRKTLRYTALKSMIEEAFNEKFFG
ncbi:MAG: ATP-dependent RecD-like DNA helicase [Clostridia bacterium]|nr:ATP-dependent RecD-like DNA helicase [Clostridia bacterium]